MQAVRPPTPPLTQGFLFGREKGKGGGTKGGSKKREILAILWVYIRDVKFKLFYICNLGLPWMVWREGWTHLPIVS